MSFPYSWKYVPNPGDALQEAIRQRQSLQDCLDSCQDWNARACNEYLQKHSCQYRFRDRLSHKRSVIADHQWFCNRRKSANAATTAEPESTQPTASGSQKTNQPSNSERIAEETDSKGKGNNFTKKEGKRGKGKAAEDVVGYSGASGKEKCSNSDGQGMDTAFQLKNLPTAKLSSGKCSKTVEDVTCSLFKSAKPASGAADSFQKKDQYEIILPRIAVVKLREAGNVYDKEYRELVRGLLWGARLTGGKYKGQWFVKQLFVPDCLAGVEFNLQEIEASCNTNPGLACVGRREMRE